MGCRYVPQKVLLNLPSHTLGIETRSWNSSPTSVTEHGAIHNIIIFGVVSVIFINERKSRYLSMAFLYSSRLTKF